MSSGCGPRNASSPSPPPPQDPPAPPPLDPPAAPPNPPTDPPPRPGPAPGSTLCSIAGTHAAIQTAPAMALYKLWSAPLLAITPWWPAPVVMRPMSATGASVDDSLHTRVSRLDSPVPAGTCLCTDTTSASSDSSGCGCGELCMREENFQQHPVKTNHHQPATS